MYYNLNYFRFKTAHNFFCKIEKLYEIFNYFNKFIYYYFTYT